MLDVNKNDKVLIGRFRSNPQLGDYATFEVRTVERVNKKSFVVVDSFNNKQTFNLENGESLKHTNAAYGSVNVIALTKKEATATLLTENINGVDIVYTHNWRTVRISESYLDIVKNFVDNK